MLFPYLILTRIVRSVFSAQLGKLSVGLLLGLVVVEPAALAAADDPYRTVVRGKRSKVALPEDDKAAFSSRVTLGRTAEGEPLNRKLASVPGLRLRDVGSAGRLTVTIRGAESHQVVVYLDGVRLTAPGRQQVDLGLINPALLSAVEVRRTAAASRFGGGAMGGVLLLETARLTSRARSSVQASYGAFQTWGVQGSHGSRIGSRVRFLLGASYRQSDGDYRFVDHNGAPAQRQNNDSKHLSLLAKADTFLGKQWRVSALSLFSWRRAGAPGPMQSPSLTARQREWQNTASLTAEGADVFGPASLLTLRLFHRFAKFRFDETAPQIVLSRNTAHTLGGRLHSQLQLGESRLTLGGELREQFFRDPSTDNPNRLETDLWITGEVALVRWLTVLPAVRGVFAQRFSPAAVPKLGVLLQPWAKTEHVLAPLEAAVNVGRAYRYPSFQEMFVRLDGFGGNADLKPEDALNVDAGIRWRAERVWLEVVYFQRWIDNLILFAPVSANLVRPDNFGDAESYGSELSGTVKPGACIAATAAYTWTRTRFGTPEAQLPGHPQHRVSGRLSWNGDACRADKLTLSSAWRWLVGLRLWISATYDSAQVLARFNALPEEGRVMLGAGGAYRYRAFTLTAQGYNLLNKRDAVDTVGFPLQPASFLLSLRADI